MAENGQKGLKLLFDDENKVDLVILDVNMPKMNGFQVLEKIRTSNTLVSKTPVIMLTAEAQKKDLHKSIEKWSQ